MPAEADFEGVVLDVHVLSVREDSCLETTDVTRGDDTEVEFLALFEYVRPDVVGVDSCVMEVDFEANFG